MIGDLIIETGTMEKWYMRDTDTFAWRLRQHRDAMKITQFEMCDRIVAIVRRHDPEFSMSYPAYNKMETGDTATPKHNVLRAIREITGLSLDYLIANKESEASEFDSDEARRIGAMIDDMLPQTRQFLETIAAGLLEIDQRQHESNMRAAELLSAYISEMRNGDRQRAREYIQSTGFGGA